MKFIKNIQSYNKFTKVSNSIIHSDPDGQVNKRSRKFKIEINS